MSEQIESPYAGRTLVVILAMHRSGSSMVTGLLQRLGMSLGPFELLGADEHNKHGHFEAMPLLGLDKELLGQVFGFAEDVPDSPEVLRRFIESEGRWSLDALPNSAELVERGRMLVEQLVISGQIAGFKDPRIPLLWPFWSRVFADFPGLRVVPIFLVRSPHEIAMSTFMRARGRLGYYDVLDVAAVHYKQLNNIFDRWKGEKAVVRFEPQVLTEDLQQAANACQLAWSQEIFSQVYDTSCRHHEPVLVAHQAEESFQRLGRMPTYADGPENLRRLARDAKTREIVMRSRLDESHQEIQRLAMVADQLCETEEQLREVQGRYDQMEGECRERIAQLESQLALIRGSRTWRLRTSLLTAVRWLSRPSHQITVSLPR